MRWIKAFTIAIAAMACTVLPASAQAYLPTTGTENVLYSVTASTVESLITEHGLVAEVDVSSGKPVIRAYASAQEKAAKNPLFFIGLAACDLPNQPSGCLGLHFARVSAIQQGDIPKAARVATAFHARYSFGRVYPVVTGASPVIVMDYYTMTDKGVSRAHLSAVINEYMGLVTGFQDIWSTTN